MTACSHAGKIPFLRGAETAPGALCTRCPCMGLLVRSEPLSRGRGPCSALTTASSHSSWAVCRSQISRPEAEAAASDGKTNSREVGGVISSHLQLKAPPAVLVILRNAPR